jgi:uncharacterized protein (DUF2235 family)
VPKRICVCFDGTWNTPNNDADLNAVATDNGTSVEKVDSKAGVETNVCRLYRSIKVTTKKGAGAVPQIKWYDKGVGTNWYDRAAGGAFGLGLSRKIREGYKYLSDVYDDGDEVFVFGFSRGAYTARSFVGMIRNCGLFPKGTLKKDDPDANVELMEAYELYRTRDSDPDSIRAKNFRDKYHSQIIEILFLGVWDTVGALGIPIESFGEFNKEQFQFHDTELSGIVKNAYHALAVDEHREPYAPTLWAPIKKLDQTIEQRWFVGAHADVGGGYEDRRLSDLTLNWMQQKAQACGLDLDPAGIPNVGKDNMAGSLTDSFRSFMHGFFHLFQKPHYRPIFKAEYGNEQQDDCVGTRMKDDVTYRPKNPGLKVGP